MSAALTCNDARYSKLTHSRDGEQKVIPCLRGPAASTNLNRISLRRTPPSLRMKQLHFVPYTPSPAEGARSAGSGRGGLDRASRAHVGRVGRRGRHSLRELPFRASTERPPDSALGRRRDTESEDAGTDSIPGSQQHADGGPPATRPIPSPRTGRVTKPTPAVFGASASILNKVHGADDSPPRVAHDSKLQGTPASSRTCR